jgi:hypothetical protein
MHTDIRPRFGPYNGGIVSTVYLGVDHSFGNGPPLLYETMVFGCGKHDKYQRRYSTQEEALAGHWETVAMVKRDQ